VDIYNFIALGFVESLYYELVFFKITYLKQYRQVALGGTFDILHKGHLELLGKSFEIGLFVIIGVTSDEFVRARLNKQIRNPYPVRVQNLRNVLQEKIKSSNYEITKLNDSFGPLMISGDVDCLVVSSETEEKGKTINHVRVGLGLPAVDVVLVKLVLAEDGIPISSSRIRSNEIDENGFKTNK
jgi:pantetheine-phosphate adenylyltransferase